MTATHPDVPTDGRPQVAVRVDPETIRELDELAAQASTPLASVSRSDVLRRAITLGMEQIRAELGLDAAKPKRRKAKA